MSKAQNQSEPEGDTSGTYAEALRAVPPGENYLHLTAKRGHPDPQFEWRRRYWSFLLKLHPDRPSPTIQGQPGPWVGPFHWDNRRLRVAELKRLMTFPDRFVVTGNRRDQQLQLGNAVPPILAERLLGQLAAELQRVEFGEGVRILFIGFFAQQSWNGVSDGLIYGDAAQLGEQALAAAVVPVYAFVVTFLILRAIALVTPLRATEREEALGMDIVQHGEEAYATGEGAILIAPPDGEVAVAGRD